MAVLPTPRPGLHPVAVRPRDEEGQRCRRSSATVCNSGAIDRSGFATYDLNRNGRLVDLYRTILIEATNPADPHAHLDQTTAGQLSPRLWLPAQLRRAQEDGFPDLRRTEADAAA